MKVFVQWGNSEEDDYLSVLPGSITFSNCFPELVLSIKITTFNHVSKNSGDQEENIYLTFLFTKKTQIHFRISKKYIVSIIICTKWQFVGISYSRVTDSFIFWWLFSIYSSAVVL